MARDARIEARLIRWANRVTVGDGNGYPAVCVLDPSWSPPSPGTTPTMKINASDDAMQTHRAIARLSRRQQDTVVVHYVLKPPMVEQAQMLQCTADAVHMRVSTIHRLLVGYLRDEFCKDEQPA